MSYQLHNAAQRELSQLTRDLYAKDQRIRDLEAELRDVAKYIPGWREMIAELEDHTANEALLKGMIAALDQIDITTPKIRAALGDGGE